MAAPFPAHDEAHARGATRVVVGAWLVLAVVQAGATFVTGLDRPFVYPHALVSAHFATMARSFAAHGVFALHGIPVQNNPPLGVVPDVYIHWPPLFPIVLSRIFLAIGDSEAVVHGTMLGVLLLTTAGLVAVATRCWGRTAGLATGAAFLSLPVTLTFGGVGLHLHLALGLMVWSLYASLRAVELGPRRHAWGIAGGALLALAVATSWEPVAFPLGLVGASRWLRSRCAGRVALAYTAVAGGTALLVLGLFLFSWPGQRSELIATVLMRSGAVPVAELEPIPSLLALGLRYARRLEWLGVLGLAGLTTVAVAFRPGRQESDPRAAGALALAGSLAPWPFWFVVMRHHAYVHDYEMALAAPVAALAVGFAATRITARLAVRQQRWLRLLGLAALPAAAFLHANALAGQQLRLHTTEWWLVPYGEAIGAVAEPGAVVLSPLHVARYVPAYYSRRHMIGGVGDDADVLHRLPGVRRNFPGAPIYLAVPPPAAVRFTASLASGPLVSRSPFLLLVRLAAGDRRPPGETDPGGRSRGVGEPALGSPPRASSAAQD